MSLALANKTAVLHERARMFAKVRAFFAKRHVIEVDTPILSKSGAIDPYIDLVAATCCGKRSYLHSSPEYAMKRLLALGIGDCYQLGHVFRDSESGEKHNPEFSMIEWYRHGFFINELIDETVELVALFLGELPLQRMSYEQAFYTFANHFPDTIEERDRLFADVVEPKLEGLVVLTDYPPEQACLAKTELKEAEIVALRFELFFNGVELGNGYHELSNLLELKQRLTLANQQRIQMGKQSYPLDQNFLSAPIPDCCGVAIGFDRLMMLKEKASHIRDVIPFHWDEL